jgi:hypothetical protein
MDTVQTYLHDLHEIRSTGAAVPETSFYPPLERLLTTIGKGLKPRVRAIINVASVGAGIPDGGLYTTDQFQRGSSREPIKGQLPSRGVIEAKPVAFPADTGRPGEEAVRPDQPRPRGFGSHDTPLPRSRDRLGHPVPVQVGAHGERCPVCG